MHQYVAVVNEKTLYVDAKNEVIEVKLMKPVYNVNPNLFIFDEASLKVNIDRILNVFPVFFLNIQFSARINLIWRWRILNLSNLSVSPRNKYVLHASLKILIRDICLDYCQIYMGSAIYG